MLTRSPLLRKPAKSPSGEPTEASTIINLGEAGPTQGLGFPLGWLLGLRLSPGKKISRLLFAKNLQMETSDINYSRISTSGRAPRTSSADASGSGFTSRGFRSLGWVPPSVVS